MRSWGARLAPGCGAPGLLQDGPILLREVNVEQVHLHRTTDAFSLLRLLRLRARLGEHGDLLASSSCAAHSLLRVAQLCKGSLKHG